MEYENIRMPELKSLAREHRLRGYSRMRKAELVAFLTIWVKLFSTVQGQTTKRGKASNKTCVISQFSGDLVDPGPFDGE